MSSPSLSAWEKEFDDKDLPSSNDFRSDTVTLPNGAMLASILSNASDFGDDVYSEDVPTNALEKHIGELTGMKHAIFVSSGTMGNQIALRCHLTQPPYSVICDRRSHIFGWECGMASMFSQAHMIPVIPNAEKNAYLTLEDVIPNVVLDDGDAHAAPTRVITIENTFLGKIIPVEEIKRISEYARKRGIKVHLDGARLWNACYSSTVSSSPVDAADTAKALLLDYCSCVDSVSLCFSKSLGAPFGSILLSNCSDFIKRARHFRKALGGGLRQLGVLACPARVAVDTIFLSGTHLPRTNMIAKQLEDSWKGMGGPIQPGLSQETNMLWLDLGKLGVKVQDFAKIAAEEGIKVDNGRIVVHYQISHSATIALERVFHRILVQGHGRSEER